MADKTQYYPYYWAAVPPVVAEKVLTRIQPVLDLAGIQGKKIGTLGVGAHVMVDLNEDDNGCLRIVRVVDYPLGVVPANWIEYNQDPERPEFWTDKTGLMDAGAPIEGEVSLLVKRNAAGVWSVTEL